MDNQQLAGPSGSVSGDKEASKPSCQYCKRTFARKDTVKKHQGICKVALEALGKEAERFKCDHCEATFSRKDKKSNHMKKDCKALKPPNLEDEKDPRKVQCPHCSRWLKKQCLKGHLKVSCEVTTKSQKRIPCPGCSATFKSQRTLRQHQDGCPGKNVPKTLCPKCSKGMLKRNLTQHLKSCSGPKLVVKRTFKCLKCPKVYKSSKERTHHKRYYCKVYNAGKEVLCPHCKKKFVNEITLKRHIAKNRCAAIKDTQTKTGEEPIQYICDHCPRTLPSKESIKVHMLYACPASLQAKEKQLGIKIDLTCRDCSGTYKSLASLYRHRRAKFCKVVREFRLQKGVKEEFPCLLCGKKFMTKDTLFGHKTRDCRKARRNRHAKAGKRIFVQCHFCQKRFWSNIRLRQHITFPAWKYNRQSGAAGDPMPKPKCQLCGQEFPATCMLRKHMIRLCPVKLAVPKHKRYVFGTKFIERQKLIHPFKCNYPCSDCGFIAQKFDEVLDHMKTLHNYKFDERDLEVPDHEVDNGSHICFVCAKEYQDYDLTREHISTCFENKFVYHLSADVEEIAPDGGNDLVSDKVAQKAKKKRQTKSRCKIMKLIGDSNEMYYPCFMCGFISAELEDIKSHLKSDHRYNADNLAISEPESSAENKNCRFKCFLCNEEFCDYELTREHSECCLDNYL